MPDIAPPILEYVYDLTIKDRSPAFLLLKQDGRIQEWGGKLETYGIRSIKEGDPIEEHVLILDGFFPLDEERVHLPCVETEAGVSADIHIFQGEKGYWILFLDATMEEARQSVLQQRMNELCLLRDKQTKLMDQYLGKEVAEKLVRTGLQEAEESKYVSVLFADIRGFTAYSEQKSSVDVFKLLNAYLSAIIQPVLDEGGSVDKIIGEAVMAIFGISPSNVSPSLQAVKAAFRIIENVQSLQKARQTEGQDTLEVGIGIASGQVFLGIMGSRNRRTLSAIGHSVNLASFLESQSRSNEILIDKNTFLKIEGLQDRFTRATLKLRGVEGPLQAFSCE
ncbi:adenylate/guanylate cyclase domain-containing protein [Desulfobacterales bacterium HSG2]|nr:adenylate/guanylate cyclase domain-containing protein [Desulfobacterales bacterium HSG2]